MGAHKGHVIYPIGKTEYELYCLIIKMSVLIIFRYIVKAVLCLKLLDLRAFICLSFLFNMKFYFQAKVSEMLMYSLGIIYFRDRFIIRKRYNQ
jgi:hypothetical protein